MNTATQNTATTNEKALADAEQRLKAWGFSRKRAAERKLKDSLAAVLADGLVASVSLHTGGASRLTVFSEWADGTRRAALVLEFDELDDLCDAVREVRGDRG